MTSGLAFYHGPGDWIDAAIRTMTRSPFSHVELVVKLCPNAGEPMQAIGASWRDRGVRQKRIKFDLERWTLLETPWAPQDAAEYAFRKIGASYDLSGILFSQVFALRRQDARRWFCSELCASALGLGAPETFSPGSLFSVVQDLNRVWAQGVKMKSASGHLNRRQAPNLEQLFITDED
jgi:hypothetical protein